MISRRLPAWFVLAACLGVFGCGTFGPVVPVIVPPAPGPVEPPRPVPPDPITPVPVIDGSMTEAGYASILEGANGTLEADLPKPMRRTTAAGMTVMLWAVAGDADHVFWAMLQNGHVVRKARK